MVKRLKALEHMLNSLDTGMLSLNRKNALLFQAGMKSSA